MRGYPKLPINVVFFMINHASSLLIFDAKKASFPVHRHGKDAADSEANRYRLTPPYRA
jgi:hypothetical protein